MAVVICVCLLISCNVYVRARFDFFTGGPWALRSPQGDLDGRNRSNLYLGHRHADLYLGHRHAKFCLGHRHTNFYLGHRQTNLHRQTILYLVHRQTDLYLGHRQSNLYLGHRDVTRSYTPIHSSNPTWWQTLTSKKHRKNLGQKNGPQKNLG